MQELEVWKKIRIGIHITGQNPATKIRHYMDVVGLEKFKELTSKVKFE